MSDQSPYEKIGVSEDASFDEIQEARNRLLEKYGGEGNSREVIEAAYDAILMQRLRMRQEGKIKVPERIRFPEMRVRSIPQVDISPNQQAPEWLRRSLDKPTLSDVLLPGVCYLGLGAISLFYPGGTEQILQLALVAGVGTGIYFLNRKEGKFSRAVLLTLVSLIIGLTIGSFIAAWTLPLLLPLINLTANQFSTLLTFIFMWLVSSFLR